MHRNTTANRSLAIAGPILMAMLPWTMCGCQALQQHGLMAPPGPMNYQQANAVIHDPFPLPDIGPDDNSMRPPDYQNPLSLPVRNQMKTEISPWLLP